MTREQQQFLDVVDLDEAIRRWWKIISSIEIKSEKVSLEEALGRTLAEDIFSDVDVPGFDRSNVDGYAVIASDTFSADEFIRSRLKLTSEIIQPGDMPILEIQSGFATPIATGSIIPRGADSVIMLEQTILRNNEIEVLKPVAPGSHISHAGSDIARGELILTSGTHLTPRETGLLAATGRHSITVIKLPRVAILSSGNEIVSPGDQCPTGKIFDSNARIIADSVREAGGLPEILGIVPDELATMQLALNRAISISDLVIITGGTSKGSGDISFRALESLSPGILVHGVALKPGKPVCLGAADQVPVAILPGFPTSAIFTFHELVEPVIRHLTGHGQITRNAVQAKIATRVNSERGRTEFLLVNLIPTHDGLVAYPMGKGSGSVTTFSRADGFITIDKHQEFLAHNESVQVTTYSPNIQPADLVIIGSHCIGLDEIGRRLSASGISLKMMSVGSQGGIDAAVRGECDIAGTHLLDPLRDVYNLPFLSPELKLLKGYGRMQGMVFRPDDLRFSGLDLEKAISIGCSQARMVSRNRGSGTRVLIDKLLRDARPTGYTVEMRSHHAVAAAVSQQRADWGVTIEPVARLYGLGFIPIRLEEFDFVIPVSKTDKQEIVEFQRLLTSVSFQEKLQQMGFITSPETGQWAR